MIGSQNALKLEGRIYPVTWNTHSSSSNVSKTSFSTFWHHLLLTGPIFQKSIIPTNLSLTLY